MLKVSETAIEPFIPKHTKYSDPWLGCEVKKIKTIKSSKRIQLPTTRQYYLLHKGAFTFALEVNPKYEDKMD
jgi:hypothetical protein